MNTLRHWQAKCINAALYKYNNGGSHFLCLATPGAGKTHMAATLARHLLKEKKIDLVICFSPAVIVASDFQLSLESQIGARLDGKLGSMGQSLTYQSMLHLDDNFWNLFDRFRIFVIFDEIHHCAGDSLDNANAWGEQIILRIQGRAQYTLALTGTPWRSDRIPIALASYSNDQKVHCDFIYGLTEAVKDRVCRIPRITLIDNDRILLNHHNTVRRFSSFTDLLKNSLCNYQQLIENEVLITYLLRQSSEKLKQIRKGHPAAGGLIVTASVEHAYKVADILYRCLGETAAIATYMEDNAQNIIANFRHGTSPWIISVGMISEGTNIPRLRVCCHLTRVKTELHFRQVLGRVLRMDAAEGESCLFIPAEPSLIDYARRVAEEIPASGVANIELMPTLANRPEESFTTVDSESLPFELVIESGEVNEVELSLQEKEAENTLSEVYVSTLNIFGRFKKELVSLGHVMT